MATGVVKVYFLHRSFGYIAPDEGGADVYVHWSKITGQGYRYLAPGERVRFEAEIGGRGTPAAVSVEPEGPRLRGTVETWDQMRGTGRIKPEREQASLFFHHSDILTVGRATAVEGEGVTFEIEQSDRGRKAVQVKRLDPRRPLDRFARLGEEEDWAGAVAPLVALAEREDWNLYGEADAQAGDNPILVSYLAHTFARLEVEEHERNRGDKIAVAESGQYACFNTGLVTPLQEEIFAFFEVNRTSPDLAPWFLKAFVPESDRRLDANFGGRLPELARYFDDPAQLIYNPDLPLVMDASHIVEDNLERFPSPFQQNAYMTEQVLEGQRARLERRARRNYKTAVPQYHHGAIQLLLPLHLSERRHADLALVVERTADCYRAATVLPLQWAYRNARLLTKPDPDWLVPDDASTG